MPSLIASAKVLYALARITKDPSQLEVVFSLVDTLRTDPESVAQFTKVFERPELDAPRKVMLRTPTLVLSDLDKLPEGSFGRAAAAFFRAANLDPGALPRTDPTNDVEWLSAHLYETHDLWHVLTGFGPDVASELGLQAFYAAQFDAPLPVAILSAGLLNSVLFTPSEGRGRIAAIARGWAMGEKAKLLVGQDWTKYLAMPLESVRAELGVVVDPAEDATKQALAKVHAGAVGTPEELRAAA
ncbi:MAG: Coq4 family protein [Polyangiaceae bacterium]